MCDDINLGTFCENSRILILSDQENHGRGLATHHVSVILTSGMLAQGTIQDEGRRGGGAEGAPQPLEH